MTECISAAIEESWQMKTDNVAQKLSDIHDKLNYDLSEDEEEILVELVSASAKQNEYDRDFTDGGGKIAVVKKKKSCKVGP